MVRIDISSRSDTSRRDEKSSPLTRESSRDHQINPNFNVCIHIIYETLLPPGYTVVCPIKISDDIEIYVSYPGSFESMQYDQSKKFIREILILLDFEKYRGDLEREDLEEIEGHVGGHVEGQLERPCRGSLRSMSYYKNYLVVRYDVYQSPEDAPIPIEKGFQYHH